MLNDCKELIKNRDDGFQQQVKRILTPLEKLVSKKSTKKRLTMLEIMTLAKLGEERIEQYRLNRYPLEKVFRFFIGDLQNDESTRNHLMGFEFNVHLLNYLKSINAKNIRTEVPINKGRVDAIAQKDGKLHVYEAKCTKSLELSSGEWSRQIKTALKFYKGCKPVIYVPKDCTIEPMYESFAESYLGAEIQKADITKSDIENNLIKIQDELRSYNEPELSNNQRRDTHIKFLIRIFELSNKKINSPIIGGI